MAQQEAGISWNKIITICSAFGIPLLSILCWLIFSGTQLVDKVNAMSRKQDDQDHRMDKFENKLDHVIDRIDTIASHQYRYVHPTSSTRLSKYHLYVQLHTANGIEWVPYRQ